jgi:hypothetical protein
VTQHNYFLNLAIQEVLTIVAMKAQVQDDYSKVMILCKEIVKVHVLTEDEERELL